ncbi:MAG: hypothetical protein H6975_04680 [Gammaproteobacteria bacterium]|nr:hypothetical protein [Gammaproteobacteria bacterium]
MFDRVVEMLRVCGTGESSIPPTVLYNEGWMLRLVLDWFANHSTCGHELSFLSGSRWYSEALIAPPFLPEFRGDPRAESYTHADGVVGHFRILPGERAEATLLPDARQLIVVEAKLGSRLSSGVTHARTYDQAARNVACIANMLAAQELNPRAAERLGFYVVAPDQQIRSGVFRDLVTLASIERKVSERVSQYAGARDSWFSSVFKPMLEHIDVGTLSWESILDAMEAGGAEARYRVFYKRCLEFNALRSV